YGDNELDPRKTEWLLPDPRYRGVRWIGIYPFRRFQFITLWEEWRMGQTRKIKMWAWSLGIAAALVGSAAVPRVLAQSRQDIDERCQRQIQHAEHELHEAIERHGRESRQADHERHELREARERCWRENHRWWDEHEHRWHEEHDWDDRE